jgi:hypothetical protein
MAAGNNQPAPALDKNRHKVPLTPHNFGNPFVEINAGSKDHSDVARR